MKITKSKLIDLIRETLDEKKNPCWPGHSPGGGDPKQPKTKIGKSGKRVANCKKINEDDEENLAEDEGSTIKYNADPALKGDQTTLPDKLQKGIIDKANKKKSKNESKMKITKRQLQRIIKEEKARLINEVNPDGTISDNEDTERRVFLSEVESEIEDLIRFIQTEAERIGGGFRGPGIKMQALKLVAELVHEAR